MRRTILVVETEYLIALEIKDTLEAIWDADILIVHRADAALDPTGQWRDAMLAVIEFEQDRADLTGLVRKLREAQIPVIGISADIRLLRGSADFPGVPIMVKPVPTEDLAETARSLVSKDS